jgi:hypothetical protein
MWKWLAWAAAVPIGAGLLVVAVGAMLPRDHVAAAEAVLPASAPAVAAMVRAIEAQPEWRGSVKAIESVERRERGLLYLERSANGTIAFDFVEEVPDRRFRSTIADPALPFGGFWTIALAPRDGGTHIRIEEHGSVRNPIYRFFSALVFGHETTMKAYLADLERALRR